ncbi:4-hydroxyphenylpyruvate dioxygenase [Actinomadura rayongensis]|uniref:4-hydroxyphenylpyruvate dioxygenase n=1 Tax=Actinomadura rayongensis TaxID=1429076 RepID=A0A6I4VXH3_9ACTN|nr:4-hydroxyphenylpyruvate dioxygenase [Actinomadura rayongensis]
MDIRSVDHIELFVADADQAAARLADAYGFAITGRSTPWGAGDAGYTSVLLRQRDITVLLTAATGARHRAAEYVERHGDGVAVIGLVVDDAHAAFAAAVERGAEPVAPPETLGPDGGRVTFASVAGFGDVEHRFVSRERPGGPFAPGAFAETGDPAGEGLLTDIDHFAVCVPAGDLDPMIRRYGEVFGMEVTFEEQIVVGNQAMRSKVIQSRSRGLTFTILEPDTSRSPGQIDAFVAGHRGPGIQHVAYLTDDIARAVATIASRGVRFLTTPDAYYDELPARLGQVGVPTETLRELNILADRDHGGVMLQIFTESAHPRRTYFDEVIDRRGARTFGSNNIKALYEAVERQSATGR